MQSQKYSNNMASRNKDLTIGSAKRTGDGEFKPSQIKLKEF